MNEIMGHVAQGNNCVIPRLHTDAPVSTFPAMVGVYPCGADMVALSSYGALEATAELHMTGGTDDFGFPDPHLDRKSVV